MMPLQNNKSIIKTVSMYVCVFICMCMWCMYVHMCVCVYVVYVCTHLCLCVCGMPCMFAWLWRSKDGTGTLEPDYMKLWVLGTELSSSVKASRAPKSWMLLTYLCSRFRGGMIEGLCELMETSLRLQRASHTMGYSSASQLDYISIPVPLFLLQNHSLQFLFLFH